MELNVPGFSVIWKKSLRKMTLSPVWSKGACSAGGENSLSREQNQRAEQSRKSLETPTSHTEPRDNTNSPKLNSSHSPQANQAGGNCGALHTEQAGPLCVAQAPSNHTELCPVADASPCSQPLHQAEPQSCCNKALGTPRQSKHEAQPGTGTGWTLGHSVSPAHGERTPKPAVGAAQLPSLSTTGFQGSTKQLGLTQQNREGEEFRQNQGTHGAEKCSEWLQSPAECCVQGTQAASVPGTS